jgi:hypothetical protein
MNAPFSSPTCPLCGQREGQLVRRQPAQKEFQPTQIAPPPIYLLFRCPCGVSFLIHEALIHEALMDRAKSA